MKILSIIHRNAAPLCVAAFALILLASCVAETHETGAAAPNNSAGRTNGAATAQTESNFTGDRTQTAPAETVNTTSAENETASLPAGETVDLTLGETSVQAVIYRGKTAEPRFFNMHDDENTSVEAGRKSIAASGGILVELKHTGAREISFKLKGKSYKIDPNRIFTSAGIAKTLKNYGATSPDAVKAVDDFAKNLIAQFLAGSKTIVALHNNTENAYSIKSYEKGGEYERDAAQVFINPEKDIDDFFFVTEQKHFDALKSRGYNVALQNNSAVTDDGSLSVYCGREKIVYVNVEAQHGREAEQLKMLGVLREVLGNQ